MRTNYRVNSGVRFNMLSKEQLEELYQGVLHVLEYTGLEVHHEESRDILKKAGAWVDGLRVRIPSWLVKRSLEMAPRSFTLFARDGNPKHNIHISPGRRLGKHVARTLKVEIGFETGCYLRIIRRQALSRLRNHPRIQVRLHRNADTLTWCRESRHDEFPIRRHRSGDRMLNAGERRCIP